MDELNITCYEYLRQAYEKNGDFPAAITYGHKVKLSTLMSHIDNLAAYFAAHGLREGDVYTVFLPTCIHSFVAFYALSKIGVIANIVHPLTSPEALAETMEFTGSKGVMMLDVLTPDYVEMLNEVKLPCIICSTSDYVGLVKAPAIKAYESVKSRKLVELRCKTTTYKIAVLKGSWKKAETIKCGGTKTAVYLHGGGTTGHSKTIMLSNNAINNLAVNLEPLDSPHNPGDECSLIVLPMFHAFGLATAMHYSLTHGYTCIPVAKFSPKDANKTLAKYPVSFIVGVPNMFKKMMEDEGFAGEHLRRLRLVFCGGDVLSEQLVREFNSAVAKEGGKGRLMRGYGLTESSSVCCVNTYEAHRADSIGKPLTGLKVEIWDEMRKELSANEIGEIVVSGNTLMQGYYNADQTVPDDGVYVDKNGERWILTGDLGYKDDDGFIFFTGRKKRLIVISGYNVYPMDIENCVQQLPFVKEACAVQGYLKGKPCVKLCVVLEGDIVKEAAETKILHQCKANLSKFSCPRKIEFIDALPRTRMAKVDFMKLTDAFPQNTSRKDK